MKDCVAPRPPDITCAKQVMHLCLTEIRRAISFLLNISVHQEKQQPALCCSSLLMIPLTEKMPPLGVFSHHHVPENVPDCGYLQVKNCLPRSLMGNSQGGWTVESLTLKSLTDGQRKWWCFWESGCHGPQQIAPLWCRDLLVAANTELSPNPSQGSWDPGVLSLMKEQDRLFVPC